MSLQTQLTIWLAALGLDLAKEQNETALAFLDELLRWNKTHNLTAITDPQQALEKHLVDSLTLLPHLGTARRLLDIGSGGGFPAIPLAIARPDLQIVSVDAVAKKIAFQRHAARKFGLRGLTPWHGRIEALPEQELAAGGFDLVVARAFTALPGLLELALPCLNESGRIIAMKGADAGSELAAAGDWLAGHDLVCRQQLTLRLPASGAERSLLIFSR